MLPISSTRLRADTADKLAGVYSVKLSEKLKTSNFTCSMRKDNGRQ